MLISRTRTLLIALTFTACVSPPPSIAPASSNDVTVRGEGARRVDQYLEAAQHFGFSAAVLVADRDGVLLRQGYGAADARRRIRPDMYFDMGSMVKQFTATGILLLEAEGKLSTSDKLSRYFKDAPPDKADITLHQLLTHTSGVVSDVAGDYDHITRDSLMRAVLFSPLVASPGKEFNYSNVGFSTLAVIIELVSGQDYMSFMNARVFGPTQMTQTGYSIPQLDSSRVANSFTPPVDQGTPAERLARVGGPGWNLLGNGGMLTTVDDIYRYERALREGTPVSHAIQMKQFSDQFRRSPTLANGYDWWIEPAEDGGIQFNRGGDGPETGVVAEYRRYPKDSSTFVMLANNRHHGWSTRRYMMGRMRRLYLGTATYDAPVVQGASAGELGLITGTYALDSTSSFRIERIGDHLSLSAVGQRAADVMIFNRDSSSLRNRVAINQRALNLLRALARKETAPAGTFESPADERAVRDAWVAATERSGAARCIQVLGSDRLDRSVFQTTARVSFANGATTIRWVWSGPVAARSSEDGRLPVTLGIGADAPVDAATWSPYWWLQGRDSAVTYDLITMQTLSMKLDRNDRGRVNRISFMLPNGESISAARADREMAPACT